MSYAFKALLSFSETLIARVSSSSLSIDIDNLSRLSPIILHLDTSSLLTSVFSSETLVAFSNIFSNKLTVFSTSSKPNDSGSAPFARREDEPAPPLYEDLDAFDAFWLVLGPTGHTQGSSLEGTSGNLTRSRFALYLSIRNPAAGSNLPLYMTDNSSAQARIKISTLWAMSGLPAVARKSAAVRLRCPGNGSMERTPFL